MIRPDPSVIGMRKLTKSDIMAIITIPTSQLRLPFEALANVCPPSMTLRIKKPIKTTMFKAETIDAPM